MSGIRGHHAILICLGVLLLAGLGVLVAHELTKGDSHAATATNMNPAPTPDTWWRPR